MLADPGPGSPGHQRGQKILWKDPALREAPRPCSVGLCWAEGGCGRAHLQVGEVPGAVVLLAALPGERGPEVHLDQLPVRAEADVAEDAGEGRETTLVWPIPPSAHHLPPGLRGHLHGGPSSSCLLCHHCAALGLDSRHLDWAWPASVFGL